MTLHPTWQGDPGPYDAVVRHLATLALERSASGRQLEAFVSHGCVILSGTVGSDRERVDAELAVRNVPGITGVLNCIEVSAGPPGGGPAR